MPWYVVVTKPRFERQVSKKLTQMGVAVCCPVRIERRQWSDRVKKVEVPLLPSMVLVNLDDHARSHVFDVHGVVRFLFYLGKPAIVRDHEIEALLDIKNSSNKILEVNTFSPGDVIDVPGFGSSVQKGLVKYVSGNKCWVVLEQLGFVVTLQV
tara:strand:+ start:29205 stop:29663 length:459 start_codon:yes stop_codon:yes gene_type:complete